MIKLVQDNVSINAENYMIIPAKEMKDQPPSKEEELV